MNTAAVARELGALRDELPALVGAKWPEVQNDATALLDRLQRAASDEEREHAINELVALLVRFPATRPHLQRALAAADADFEVPRGFDFEERGAGVPAGDESDGGLDGEGGDRLTGTGTDGSTLERFPHLDVDAPDPIPAGATFGVEVYVDTEGPQEGETGGPLALPDLPQVELHVMLVTSHHFVVVGDDRSTITIRREAPRSTTARFEVRALEETSGEPGITALFFHDGRPAGSVHRGPHVKEGQTGIPADAGPPAPALRVDLAARRPSLTVQIEHVPNAGNQRFACTVSSPLLDGYAEGVTDTWDLPTTTDRIVSGYMQGFTRSGASNEARRAALVGAGLALFDAAPGNFRDAYWALRDAGKPVDTVFVVSSEPYVPWELMIPNRAGNEEEPLGVSYAIGRWVHPEQFAPKQELTIQDSYVIAPTYRGSKALTFSADEAQFVCDTFRGKQISPARYETIEAELNDRGATLLHFICHGSDMEAGGQTIDLDPDETLTDFMLRGMPGVKRAVKSKQPLIFINACQVGRPTPALVGTGGFASTFIRLGARCVIAPIWSVKDSVAGKVARKFYGEVKSHPERPFADILRDIRRHAYEGSDPEDSWAAYCFYGDPMAAAGAAAS